MRTAAPYLPDRSLRRATASGLAVTVLGLVALAVPAPSATAGLADDQTLAERYAPVVRLVQQVEDCGPG